MSETERQGGKAGDEGTARPAGKQAGRAGTRSSAPPGGGTSVSAPGGGRGGGAAAAVRAARASGPGKTSGEEARRPIDVLEQLDLFRGLAGAHLKRLVAIGVEESHARGATIFEEGERGDKFYLILEGAVRISRFVAGMGEEALAVLRAGAYFGEMSLIDDEARSATAIAHEACRLFVIKRPDLEDLLFVDRDLAYDFLWKMVRTLSRRLRATNDKMTFLANTNKF